MHDKKRLRFGNCEVDELRHEVWRDGKLQPAAPKVFGLLMYLLQERHRVVRRSELLDVIWRRQNVSASVLARTIMEARKTIGDSATQPTCIKTVHRHGYRFVGPVFESAVAAPNAPVSPVRHDAVTQGQFRLGVLRCQNQTGDEAMDWTQYGLMALVGHALEKDQRLEVVPVWTIHEGVGKVPANEEAAEAIQLAQQAFGLNGVVLSAIRRQGHSLWLDYKIARTGERTIGGSLRDADAALMGERLARAISAHLFPGHGQLASFESRDPFVNETFARAIEQYLQSNLDSALRMMAAVCDMAPDSTQAQLWHLRLRALNGDVGVRIAGEALLARALQAGDVRLQAATHLIVGFAIGQAKGPSEEHRSHLNAALALAECQDSCDWVNLVHVSIAQDAEARGEFAAARTLFKKAAVGFRASGNHHHLGIIEYNRAHLAWNAGETEVAQQGFQRAMALMRATRREALAMQTLVRIAETNVAFGLYQLAEAQCGEALASIARIDNAQAAATIVGHAAGVLSSRGGLYAVERAYEQVASLSLDPRPSIRGPLAVAQSWRDFLRGDRAAVRRLAQELAVDRSIDPAYVRALLVQWLRAEDLSQDAVLIEQARAYIAQYTCNELPPHLWCATMFSRVGESCGRGNIDSALVTLGAVIEAKNCISMQSQARINAAWLHIERGDLADANRLLDDAGAWATEHPAGLATQARLAWARGDAVRAAALQRRAMNTFLGTTPRWHEALLDVYLGADAFSTMPTMQRPISESFFPSMR